ncbi:MAG TPA: polysaccharide deacetylase family protein [Gammaproteobacteria bacterium]|nr:polysaccharide deacetylase family protein [Gammaproteobacteria bacterium]
MLHKVLNYVLPHGRFASLLIILYHRVVWQSDPLNTDILHREKFKAQIQFFKQFYQIMPINEGISRLLEGSLPYNALCITFDDGYQDNVDIALPILKSYKIPATFFIATGFLQGKLMFNDYITESIRGFHERLRCGEHQFDCSTLAGKRLAINFFINKIKNLAHQERIAYLKDFLPVTSIKPLMMTEEDIQTLSKEKMLIGAHTVNHPVLSKEDDNTAYEEIKASKNYLQNIIQSEIQWFAYPNGKWQQDFDQKHCEMVKNLGFMGAFTTDRAYAKRAMDPFRIPRFTPWGRTPLKMFRQLSFYYFKNAFI